MSNEVKIDQNNFNFFYFKLFYRPKIKKFFVENRQGFLSGLFSKKQTTEDLLNALDKKYPKIVRFCQRNNIDILRYV